MLVLTTTVVRNLAVGTQMKKKSQGKDLHVVSYDLRGTVTVSDDPDDPVPETLGSIQIDF